MSAVASLKQRCVFCAVKQGEKQMKKIRILALVLAVITVFSMLAACGTTEKEDGNVSESDKTTVNVPEKEVADDENVNDLKDDEKDTVGDGSVKGGYTKGTFDGSVYVNDWANIKLALPEGFSNASQDLYSASENENTDCGLYFMANDGTSFIFANFEDMTAYDKTYDEKDLLDQFIVTAKEMYAQMDLTFSYSDKYTVVNIAGEDYLTLDAELNGMTFKFHVRRIENYMVEISAYGVDNATCEKLVSSITSIK